MTPQWSIQSSLTQLAWSQVTYLTSKNEHIWLPIKVFTFDWKLFIWLPFFKLFDQYNSIFFSNDAMKFFIFLWVISLWFWHHTFWIQIAPPFSSQTSFQSKAFSTLFFFFFLRLTFVELFDIKINVKRLCLCMYQDQTRLLINHSWQAWRYIYNNQT